MRDRAPNVISDPTERHEDRGRDLPDAPLLDLPRKIARVGGRSKERKIAGTRVPIERLRQARVDGTLELADLCGMQIARVTAEAHRIRHEAGLAMPYIHLFVQQRGISIFEHAERSARLAPGQWCICEADQSYSVRSPVSQQRVALLVPRGRLDTRLTLSSLSFRTFQSSSGASRMLCELLASLVEELPTIQTAQASVLANAVTQMLQAALAEIASGSAQPPLPWSSDRLALPERIRLYLLSHLRDPQLSVAMVAQALGKDRRALHRAVGASIREWILSERLTQSHRDLLNPALASQSITALALACGFRCYASFSRAFRVRFGLSPQMLRQQLRARPAGAEAQAGRKAQNSN